MSEALRGYSEVIKSAPDLSDPFIFRAIIFNEKGMYQKAIDDMTKAIELEGDKMPNNFTLRGNIYANAGNDSEAYQDFKKGDFPIAQFSQQLSWHNEYRAPYGQKR